jgi:hypothetical protein
LQAGCSNLPNMTNFLEPLKIQWTSEPHASQSPFIVVTSSPKITLRPIGTSDAHASILRRLFTHIISLSDQSGLVDNIVQNLKRWGQNQQTWKRHVKQAVTRWFRALIYLTAESAHMYRWESRTTGQ